MIHHTPEGHCMKLGLNFRRATGGFVAHWMWYDFATYTATTYRFRLRLHMKPRILWSVHKWNVIDEHLALHDLVPVNREWLEDTQASWRDQLRRDKASVQFGPHGQPS